MFSPRNRIFEQPIPDAVFLSQLRNVADSSNVIDSRSGNARVTVTKEIGEQAAWRMREKIFMCLPDGIQKFGTHFDVRRNQEGLIRGQLAIVSSSKVNFHFCLPDLRNFLPGSISEAQALRENSASQNGQVSLERFYKPAFVEFLEKGENDPEGHSLVWNLRLRLSPGAFVEASERLLMICAYEGVNDHFWESDIDSKLVDEARALQSALKKDAQTLISSLRAVLDLTEAKRLHDYSPYFGRFERPNFLSISDISRSQESLKLRCDVAVPDADPTGGLHRVQRVYYDIKRSNVGVITCSLDREMKIQEVGKLLDYDSQENLL